MPWGCTAVPPSQGRCTRAILTLATVPQPSQSVPGVPGRERDFCGSFHVVSGFRIFACVLTMYGATNCVGRRTGLSVDCMSLFRRASGAEDGVRFSIFVLTLCEPQGKFPSPRPSPRGRGRSVERPVGSWSRCMGLGERELCMGPENAGRGRFEAKEAQTRFRGLAGKREGVARGVRMYLPRCSEGNGKQTGIGAGGGEEFEETAEAAVEEV